MTEKVINIRISVVVPSFNRATLISETIKSVVSQTYLNWELIIVDDGSTDNSDDVIAPFLEETRIKYVKRPPDRLPGGNAARNYGYELASGEYIKWLDSDDLLTPDCLEKQLQKLDKEGGDVNFCRSVYFTQSSGEIITGEHWSREFLENDNYLENFILGKIRFSNNDGLWRKNSLPELPYDENIKNSQEFLMIIKALATNLSVSVLNENLVLVRQHERQMAAYRTYAVFAKNQRLARYYAIRTLKINHTGNNKIYKALNKSILYYLIEQIKRKDLNHFINGVGVLLRSLKISYLK